MTVILAIGGMDPSGGAGLSRDSAMAARLGARVKPVVTALTVQTDHSVNAVHPTALDLLQAQLEAALENPAPMAVKIGMVATTEQVTLLATVLPEGLPLVFDPVLRASSGGHLTPAEALGPLLQRAQVITPNLIEAARLTGLPTGAPLKDLGHALLALSPQAVLLKGGHASGKDCVDYLYSQDHSEAFTAPRLPGQWRGTGCRLATAIACGLAQDHTLSEACHKAKHALTAWLREE
ncbi:bifunctional hydroxymethylpyrimidine kinase/phosphomethylpyrimidine kinase [Arenibacterium sp. LLYu02]|uniref:bifunctional hydroxymethylpyrimidine kinase/phosphomethylpyrimidine kinase n=1 Tax=Arenibacterium sp. LLYu02 TaxID=3404132 RepID=UPI003B2222F9